MKTCLFFILALNFLSGQHPDLTSHTWKITRYSSETNPYEVPPPMPYEQSTTFSNNKLKASFFNIVSGDITFLGQDKFMLTNKDCTFADYFGDNGEVGYFFNLLCNFFNNSNFHYSIQNSNGEKILIVSSPIFQEIHFKAADLGTENEILSAATIVPNPVKRFLTIKKAGGIKSAKIYDLAGNLLHQQKVYNTTKLEIDMHLFKPGIYMIQVNNGKAVKIIKE